LRHLEATDHGAIEVILDRTRQHLLTPRLRLAQFALTGMQIPLSIGLMGFCREASDIATRSAQDQGIVASREYHSGQLVSHFITSFAPLDQPPADDDLIVCATWGQWGPSSRGMFVERPEAFFGRRSDIQDKVGDYYPDAYGPASVKLRQVTHTAPVAEHDFRYQRDEHYWLATTPADVQANKYPVGEVAYDDFPSDMWI
jgi:hypothetical protein